jgi:iron-sulfur cluster assembly accessory protein
MSPKNRHDHPVRSSSSRSPTRRGRGPGSSPPRTFGRVRRAQFRDAGRLRQFKYSLNVEEKAGDDVVLDLNTVRVFVDGFSLQYLSGVTVDYVSSMQGSGFTFTNPNATGGCGCGSSFTA